MLFIKKLNKSIISLIFLFPKNMGLEKYNEFVIWNVGQGQWTTYTNYKECLHFDMGGEFFPKTTIQRLCYDKNNFIILSHEDWDHLSFVSTAYKLLPRICILAPPLTSRKKHTKKILLKINLCKTRSLDQFDLIKPPQTTGINSNDSSQIAILNHILIPGDSSSHAEKYWVEWIPNTRNIKILILGHHGSKTSTSDLILDKLKNLKTAVASSRFERYKHPHPSVVSKLKLKKIPLLRTEVFGNLHFYF